MFEHATIHEPAGAAMTGIGQTPASDVNEVMIVKSRLGDYEVQRFKIITMPRGIIGFPDLREFVLLNLPKDGTDSFKLLQSVEEAEVGFYVLPVDRAAGGPDTADIDAAADANDIPLSDLAILLIVTARRTGESVDLTVNMRAPILVDTKAQRAVQHILADDKYAIRQKIN